MVEVISIPRKPIKPVILEPARKENKLQGEVLLPWQRKVEEGQRKILERGYQTGLLDTDFQSFNLGLPSLRDKPSGVNDPYFDRLKAASKRRDTFKR